MRIRVTTRADLFEKRKQQHIECGTESRTNGQYL